MGCHVHVLTARCDLETGRSLNIAPPGWQKTFDALRDAFNHQHGWSRPDDPARARAHQPGHRAYLEAAKLRAGLEHEADPRALTRDYLLQRVEHGAVRSRADVVASLKEAGFEVPRQGKDYVTARDPDSGARWRLKGALYEHDFEPERLDRPAAQPAGGRPAADRGDSGERAAAAWRELARRRERRAAYHRGRYGGDGRTGARAAAERVVAAPGGGHEPFSRVQRRELGADALVVGEHQSRIETLATLDVRIDQARETPAEIEETSWGVTLREIDGDRFVVLPLGALDDSPWSVGGRPALKLSSEGGSCMTELEGQSTAALERLCAHFELGQRRQGEQIEALQQRIERLSAENEVLRQRTERQDAESAILRQQFERLDEQVTGLARDYETLAATLRELWT